MVSIGKLLWGVPRLRFVKGSKTPLCLECQDYVKYSMITLCAIIIIIMMMMIMTTTTTTTIIIMIIIIIIIIIITIINDNDNDDNNNNNNKKRSIARFHVGHAHLLNNTNVKM